MFAMLDIASIDCKCRIKTVNLQMPTVFVVRHCHYEDQGLVFPVYFTTREAAEVFLARVVAGQRGNADHYDIDELYDENDPAYLEHYFPKKE
jgi:hypothetical protein